MRLLARKDHQIGANLNGFGLDNRDTNFYGTFYGTFYRYTFGRIQEGWLDR